jgi:hypothetical protein
MPARKKAARRRRRKLNVAAVLGQMVIRAALINSAAVTDDAWVVLRMDATETAASAEAVHWGSKDECGLWLANAPAGFHYLLLDIKSAKGVTK